MPFVEHPRTVNPGAPVGRLIEDPAELIRWAVNTNRLAAVDAAEWAAAIAAQPTSTAHTDLLIERTGARVCALTSVTEC